MIDAPVLGRRSEAESGSLHVFVGATDEQYTLALAHKDADLVSAAAPDLRVAQAARSWLAEADAAGWGDRDYSSVLAWLLDVADEQQDQRDDQNDEKPIADGKSADEREDDQQQD